MKHSTSMSNFKVILIGYLIVNVPITILIIAGTSLLLTYAMLTFSLCLLISGALGWMYWEIFINIWIKWAIKNHVEQNKLHKLGLYSLLVWPRDIKRIQKIAAKIK